jgi:DNA-binding transcriptional MerR regulator
MSQPTDRRVGSVARLSGVTVRTLHHYDQIGLLRPSGRSEAGYRRYADADLARLERILYYRELGFDLDRIRQLMTDGGGTTTAHLRRQHELLVERIGRLQRMAAAIEQELEADRMGISLTPEERFEVFGDFNPDDYTDEVEQRWGDTDAYRESARRTRGYTKADWQRFKAESEAITGRMASAMQAGLPATSTEAMDAAEAHRLQIDTWFYPCSRQMHAALGEMYVSDPRFTATYERIAPGLAQYVRDATVANAARG